MKKYFNNVFPAISYNKIVFFILYSNTSGKRFYSVLKIVKKKSIGKLLKKYLQRKIIINASNVNLK